MGATEKSPKVNQASEIKFLTLNNPSFPEVSGIIKEMSEYPIVMIHLNYYSQWKCLVLAKTK